MTLNLLAGYRYCRALISRHPRISVVSLLVAALLLGFCLGRRRPRVVTTTHTVTQTVTQEHTVYVDRVRTVTVHDAQKTRVVYRDVVSTKRPDGTVTTEAKITTASTSASQSAADTASASRTDVQTTAAVSSRTDAAPAAAERKWSLSAYGAVDTRLSRSYGVLLERRLVGPLAVGVFGEYPLRGGLALTLQF